MTTFKGTETYLIECSRENSAININDDDETNGSWSNETEFNIKTGDRISVEMVCANIRGSGTSAPTIEFSGQNVVVNGETKEYCDTKVLLEVFFYMNNNNTYSVGLPLIHPFGGINGQGNHGTYDNLVTPTNLNPRIPPNQVTNQVNNYREVNMGRGYIFPSSDGWNTEWETYGAFCNFSSQLYATPPITSLDPAGWAYGIYQFQIENPVGTFAWSAVDVGFTQADPGRVSAIRLKPSAIKNVVQTTPPTYLPNLYTDFDNGILGGRTGDDYQNIFYEGNHVFVNNNVAFPAGGGGLPPETDWLGTITKVYGVSGLGLPLFNQRVVELHLAPNNDGSFLNYRRKFDFECGDCACYVGDLYEDNPDPALSWVQPKLNIKGGSSQEGLINYDNLELSTIPIVDGKYEGRGFMRGNNGLFMYSRNTRKPQLGQNSSLSLFPDTEFNPIGLPADKTYTVDAGEYGDKPLGSQFGYRNANIQQENNNDPYIFMRNDHFGSGRQGMNNEDMPLAEPMTAFIYVTLEELLQDVNSVTAVINKRLNETITGIGTNIQQTSKLLLNSLENPEGRKPASNVIPFYNKVGFYDREVTEPLPGSTTTQAVVMTDSKNAQYRNIITDIIPIKNGGCVKVSPANFTSGRNYLAQSFGKQYDGIPGENNIATQSALDNNKETTYLREIETSETPAVSAVETSTTTVLVPEVPEVPEVPAYTLYTPQPDLYTPEVPEVPEVPESTTIYNSSADGSVNLVSDFDVANNVSPMALGNGSKLFTDDGGLNANYSTSHSRHATFDAGAGNHIYINPRAFEFEHSTYSMYDRLGITCSNTIGGLSTSSGNLSSTDSTLSQYLYQSSNSSPSSFWGTSWTSGNGGYGTGGGYLFPNTDGTDVKGNNNSGWINTWYKIDARYVRFWFISDGSATEPGWDILVARAVVTPLVPAVPAVPGFYTPQPDLETLVPAVPAIPAVPAYTTTTSLTTTTETVELVEINYQAWANPIYGNMATHDLYKYKMGDRWARLPLYDCDGIGGVSFSTPTSPAPLNGGIPRQVGKCIILNNKLTYNILDFKNPQVTNDYVGQLSAFPLSKPKDLVTNTLYENQLIYLNIPFPSLLEENLDTAEDTIIRKKWVDFAKAMRDYETYYNPLNNAPSDYKRQIMDIANWIFNGDVGMTDDRSTAQLRTFDGAPSNDPPNTAPDLSPTAPPSPIVPVPTKKYQQNRAFTYDWLNNPSPASYNSPGVTDGTSLGLPLPASNFTPKPDYRPAVYDISRTLICPTTTHEIFAGISATSNIDEEEKFRMLKELGRLKIKSRFNPKFVETAVNYINATIKGIVPPTLTDPLDSGFLTANDPPVLEEKIDTTFMESLDLGFYPYVYNLDGGYTKVLSCIMIGCDYIPNVDKISTINFGSMCWGNSIGISNSFYDNHAICPMNNDQVKRGQPLTDTVQIPPKWTQIGFQATLQVESSPDFQAPLADATAYTQTAGFTPPQIPSVWDFTTNFLTAPYINPAPGSGGGFRFKLECDGGLNLGGKSTIIWEQTSLLTAGVVNGYKFVSSDNPAWTDPTQPAYAQFGGLYLNPLLNSTNNTWILTSATGVQNFSLPTVYKNLGIGCFQIQGLGEPGAYFLGYGEDDGQGGEEMWLYDKATLSVYEFPGTKEGGNPIEPNLGLEYNKVNYVWAGSSAPAFQYDQNKGRVEFSQLQEDNILNQKSIPYSTSTSNPASTTGTKAGIINTATEDAVFSRNSNIGDFLNTTTSKPVRNAGIRAEISGVGIYKVWLCPEGYDPPNNINLSSYWNNSNFETAEEAGVNEISYWGQTEINRNNIIKGCIEANEKNWVGSLFERLGFQSHRELLPAYGNQQNRFNPTTYNQTRPDKISRGTKPLILCNAVDNSIDPALNTFFTADPSGSSVNGIPMYSNGFINDESISLALVNQQLTASAPPILSTSPFLLIESDICSTNYRSGRTQQNVLFYLMKNYQASSFIYGYGSSYSHTANQDRTLSLINTALRDPITGRLQKCSNNSTIIYKIQRDITILPPTTDALGNPLPIARPAESSTDKLLSQIVTNTDKSGKTGGGGIGSKGGPSNVAGLQQGLLGEILTQAGMNGQYVEGAQMAQLLEAQFVTIANNPNYTPQEAEIQTGIAYIIAQLLATFPIELVRDPLTNQIGMSNPVLQKGEGGPGAVSNFIGNTAGDLSEEIIRYLAQSLVDIGGIEAITALITSDPNFEGQSEALADLVNNQVRNPLTNQRLGGETKGDDEPNEVAILGFRQEGSSSFEAITQVLTQYISQPNPPEEQVRLLQQASSILTNSIRAGNRVSLSDPAGEWVQAQIYGNIGGMSVERQANLREVEIYDTDQGDEFESKVQANARDRGMETKYANDPIGMLTAGLADMDFGSSDVFASRTISNPSSTTEFTEASTVSGADTDTEVREQGGERKEREGD